MQNSLQPWLFHRGSFIERLEQHGVTDPQIQVLQQRWQLPERDERAELGLRFREAALIREVLIRNDETIWMFARTVFPRTTLTGKYRELARLKNRSLGSFLFKDPTLERSKFEFFLVEKNTPFHGKIKQSVPALSEHLFARQSIFYVSQKPLLLIEVFFPSLAALGETLA